MEQKEKGSDLFLLLKTVSSLKADPLSWHILGGLTMALPPVVTEIAKVQKKTDYYFLLDEL